MQVGLLIYGDLGTLSGGYLYDRKLVDYLILHGDGVQIVSVPWRNYAWHLSDNLSASLLKRLCALNVDVLLQDELNHPSLFWLNQRLARRVAYPIYAIVHHLRSCELRSAWQNQLYRMIERCYLKTVQGFIFNSQTTRRAVQQVGSNTQHLPWVVAYPAGDRFEFGITEAFIQQRAFEPGPLRLVFVGNIIERKGLHTLLSALAGLPGGLCALEVIGSLEVDRAYAWRIQQQVAETGLQLVVRFHGSLDQQRLVAMLKQAQVLVVPSSYEGYGIVYLEGMGAGLPAIAGRLGAAREIVSHAENGFLIQPGDAVDLAGILLTLARERERLAKLSLNALRSFRQHPNWEDMGRTVREFLTRTTSHE